MLVVHGLWTTTKREGPGLFIWLEDAGLRMKNQLFEPISDFLPGSRGNLRGRDPNTPGNHPFALDSRPLFNAVRNIMRPVFGASIPPCPLTTLDLMLPSREDAPLPSPWLRKSRFGEVPGEKDDPLVLEPWRVNGAHLPPPTALKWLVRLNPRRRDSEMTFGESMLFWKEASNLVFYSLIHGTYEPVLTKIDHQIRSRWTLNAKILANQLDQLQKRLPPSCENEFFQDGTRRTRESIVRDFFDTAIDYLIRHVSGHACLDNIQDKRGPRKRKKQNPLDSLTLPLLKGLYSKQNSFSAARDVQAAFVAMVSNWLQHSSKMLSRQWTTCFTVIPPDIGDAKPEDLNPSLRVWRVAFSLQSLRDESQHIYAQEIWENLVPLQTSDGRTLSELFLRDLGRALQYFPDLVKAMQEPYPTHYDMTTDEIYTFLTETAHHLVRSDFGVVAPPWWKKQTKRLTTKFKIDNSAFEGKSMLGFDTMVEYTWEAAVGGKNLSEEAFRKMVKHKMALLPIDGQWIEVQPEDLWPVANFFEDHDTSGAMTLREAMQLGMKSQEMKSAFEEVGFDHENALTMLFNSDTDDMPSIDQPSNLQGTLRPYQVRGLSWLSFHDMLGFGSCLADDMGLGKTVQLLSLLLHERENLGVEFMSKPTLLVCPMSVVGNWFREAQKFGPKLRAMIHHGTDRLTETTFQQVYHKFDLIITTYHLVNRDFETLSKMEWHRIALDEAQNIKNPAAQQTRAILQLHTKRRIALTGTPVENKLSELWSIMEFLNPGYLGTLKDFQSRFAVPIERQSDTNKAKLLRRLTQPFILRRLKTDKSIIQDLPDKIEMKVYCDLVEEQRAIYQAYVEKQFKEIEAAEGITRNQLVLTTLMKLKQICNHPLHFLQDDSPVEGRSGKLMRLTEMLEEALEEGDSSIIFTQFTQMGLILQKYLGEKFGMDILFMHGGVAQSKRQEMVDKFQQGSGPKIFLLTVKTGGTGLNLTAATHVFHFDRWWNPAVENQATDRAFRIGQKHNVQVHKLISIGTLEDRIDMLIEQKKTLAENVIGTDESWLSQLSTDALRDILTLRLNEGGVS